MTGGEQESGRTLADKLNVLFEMIRRPDGKPHTNEEAADWCRARTGEPFSRAYMSQLRKGERTNPTKRNLEALASFFDVSPVYFFDDEKSEQIRAELELLGALRNNAVRQVALRAVNLSPEGLGTITDMIEAIGRREAERDVDHETEPDAEPASDEAHPEPDGRAGIDAETDAEAGSEPVAGSGDGGVDRHR